MFGQGPGGDGEQVLVHQHLGLRHHAVGVRLREGLVPVVVKSHSEQGSHYPGQSLLEAGFLAFGNVDGAGVEFGDVVVEGYLQHRPVLAEETLLKPCVGLGALESYPIFGPAGVVVGPVVVPLSRKQHYHGSGGDRDAPVAPEGVAGEGTASVHYVQQLVFVQHASFLGRKQISRGVVGWRIRRPGLNLLTPHGIDRKTPVKVDRIDRQIFQVN